MVQDQPDAHGLREGHLVAAHTVEEEVHEDARARVAEPDELQAELREVRAGRVGPALLARRPRRDHERAAELALRGLHVLDGGLLQQVHRVRAAKVVDGEGRLLRIRGCDDLFNQCTDAHHLVVRQHDALVRGLVLATQDEDGAHLLHTCSQQDVHAQQGSGEEGATPRLVLVHQGLGRGVAREDDQRRQRGEVGLPQALHHGRHLQPRGLLAADNHQHDRRPLRRPEIRRLQRGRGGNRRRPGHRLGRRRVQMRAYYLPRGVEAAVEPPELVLLLSALEARHDGPLHGGEASGGLQPP
mmetsp:Transcript_89955/g.291115  ORF Transcript_89955/g.291115 Transcript_89955/m.291115 type:complete len:299 (-) Transcript_89955:1254-2150(-)